MLYSASASTISKGACLSTLHSQKFHNLQQTSKESPIGTMGHQPDVLLRRTSKGPDSLNVGCEDVTSYRRKNHS